MFRTFLSKIPAHIKLLLKLYLFNLVLFSLLRFLFYHINKSSDVGDVVFFEKLMAFRMGLEFDTAVFCWITYLLVLFWSIAYLFNRVKIYALGFYIFMSLLCIYYFVEAANIPYFKQFGNHLNKSAFLWNESPALALGIVFGSFSYWGYLLVFFLFTFVLIKFSSKQFSLFKQQLQQQTKPRWYFAVFIFVFLSVLTTLGARGRTSDRSGLHEGLSIVSQNNFINQVAINPNFTFWKTVLYNRNKKPYEVPKDIDEIMAYTRDYLGIKEPYEKSISRTNLDTQQIKNYNVVIVVMESMSVFKMGYYNGKNLTPHLDQLNKESIFCENFFSSGIHTFNGLFSTTTGFISLYDEKAMKSYVKKSFDGIGPLLSERGYETYMYTTHDPHFDNMSGFFKLNKFEHVISQYDFNFSQAESSLGVPDHVLFDKLIEVTNQRKTDKPFLSVMMTASDHGPWRIPKDIPYHPNGETPQENCTLYADWSIGRFIEQAKKLPWYKNTIFMFLGDHGLSMGHTYEMPLSYNHVPFIIHQPALFKADTISSPCYQPDIPATVMGIAVGGIYVNNTFGINVLKEKHPFVVFSADDKIGCVDDKGFYYYKILSNSETYLRKYKNLDPVNYRDQLKSKSDSMDKNMMRIYDAANYLVRTNYFLYE